MMENVWNTSASLVSTLLIPYLIAAKFNLSTALAARTEGGRAGLVVYLASLFGASISLFSAVAVVWQWGRVAGGDDPVFSEWFAISAPYLMAGSLVFPLLLIPLVAILAEILQIFKLLKWIYYLAWALEALRDLRLPSERSLEKARVQAGEGRPEVHKVILDGWYQEKIRLRRGLRSMSRQERTGRMKLWVGNIDLLRGELMCFVSVLIAGLDHETLGSLSRSLKNN